MNNTTITSLQIGGSTLISTAIATGINAEPLITALITFAVSLITLVGTELVKYLVSFLKKKRQDIEDNLKEEYKKEEENKKK